MTSRIPNLASRSPAAIPRPGGIFDPVARALDVMGDRWTLVLVRHLLGGPCGFQELRVRSGIAARVLAGRLRDLTRRGFIETAANGGRPRYQGYVPYYVAKAGVIALTEALALELAGDNILVNAIAPGPIVAPPDTTDEESRAVEVATPLGRWGGEMEIAKAVVLLLDSDFITGETIRVDGGRHVK